jgi:hypothetical protein
MGESDGSVLSILSDPDNGAGWCSLDEKSEGRQQQLAVILMISL